MRFLDFSTTALIFWPLFHQGKSGRNKALCGLLGGLPPHVYSFSSAKCKNLYFCAICFKKQEEKKCQKILSIKSVLIIGSGPIIIGQACEFDYSGTQAARSLREEGIKVILINSNPATIMTDPMMADKVYLLPLTVESHRTDPGRKPDRRRTSHHGRSNRPQPRQRSRRPRHLGEI